METQKYARDSICACRPYWGNRQPVADEGASSNVLSELVHRIEAVVLPHKLKGSRCLLPNLPKASDGPWNRNEVLWETGTQGKCRCSGAPGNGIQPLLVRLELEFAGISEQRVWTA